MSRRVTDHHRAGIAILILVLMLGASIRIGAAQGTGPNLIQTAEYDIGLDCPVTAALDPAGTTLWVLMDDCFQRHHTLRAYSVADGTRVNQDDYAAALAGLDDIFVDLFITPMGFTPDGDLSIRYNDPDTQESFRLLIPLASGGEAVTQTSASYDALLAGLTDYPEFVVYSPDHTRVVAAGAASLHVLDVQSEAEIVEIPAENATDGTLASFSADGEHLYVIVLNNVQAADDFSATLYIYSLPDGGLLRQVALPSSVAWVSPDEALAAVQLFSSNVNEQSDLVVVNLASGLISPASNLLEDPAPVTRCLNTGNDATGLGFMTSGYMSLASLHWLPDSSGVILTLSYNGEGAQGDRSVCIFNNSLLRTYRVEAEG